MNERNDWNTALEHEITQVEAIEKRLKEANLDTDTKDIIKQRILYSMQLEVLDEY